MTDSPLIDVPALRRLIADGAPLRVLDARWRLGRDDGRAQYEAGHIPGAVFVDMETELSRPGRPEEGRHPLPDDAALAEAAQRWGIRTGDTVVVYDDARMLPASRVWWALQRAGAPDVRVLDGGWQAWLAAGGETSVEEAVPEEGGIVLGAPGSADVLDTAQVTLWTGVLLDARAPERYRGETEPLDPIAGHIPGAQNLPASDLLTEDGRFLAPEHLARVFAAAGAGENIPIAAYCGSGVTAAQIALAGALIGREVTVYPGSWSAWSNTPGAPVAR